MWGCFYAIAHEEADWQVFPTRVGVFLWELPYYVRVVCLPHACGGVSL